MCHIIQWAWLCRAANKVSSDVSFGSMRDVAVPPADLCEHYTFKNTLHQAITSDNNLYYIKLWVLHLGYETVSVE